MDNINNPNRSKRRKFIRGLFLFLIGVVLKKSDRVINFGTKQGSQYSKKRFENTFPLRKRKFSLIKRNGDSYLAPNFSCSRVSCSHRLNEGAELVWKLCDGKHSINDISLAITSRYEVDGKRCLTDLAEVLFKMKQKGIIYL